MRLIGFILYFVFGIVIVVVGNIVYTMLLMKGTATMIKQNGDSESPSPKESRATSILT